MFITLTITSTHKKKSPVKMKKRRINSSKRGLIQKFRDWRRLARAGSYRLGDQTIMF
ncbi:MAG: hypothetical protein ABIH78_03955 [Candidatus Peregrinibacteria bacterium]